MKTIIDDSNWQTVKQECGVLPRYIKYGSGSAMDRGMMPVGERADVLIPRDEWKERIAEADVTQTMPVYYFKDKNVQAKSQGNTNYCWAYGLTSALEATMLRENQPYVRLAPATLGWLVRWRNQGYYLSETILGAAKLGVASSEFANDGTTNRNTFKTGWQKDALKHRPKEWWDTIGKRDLDAHVNQCVSLLLNGLPGYIAYNWWSHALMMVGVKWDEGQKDNITWLAWNSHGDGLIELNGNRGVPDEFYALRSATFSG